MEYIFIYLMIGILLVFGMLAYTYHEKGRDVTVSDVVSGILWVFVWPYLVFVAMCDLNERIGDKVLLKANKSDKRDML